MTEALFGVAKSPRVTLVDYKNLGDIYQARIAVPLTSDRPTFEAAVNGLSASGGTTPPSRSIAAL